MAVRSIDAKQSIGKRYARMDEVGTPFCFTIDGETLKDQTVTVRDRDTAAQERIALDKVGDFLRDKLGRITPSAEERQIETPQDIFWRLRCLGALAVTPTASLAGRLGQLRTAARCAPSSCSCR